MAVEVHALTPERRGDWLEFFTGNGEFNWCWCRYWDFTGDSRAWIRQDESQNREDAQTATITTAGGVRFRTVDGGQTWSTS